ncbi:GNAT family N-acetyltransferase [Gottfriedia acidiceleris]|uniref:GNAT family N-acetyltransferase n=1 Tax=Gottfriedia acidiceleris TaxID=371036 RepID=UPI002F26B26B
MLNLKSISKENWIEVVRLCSSEDQKNKIFEETIASNCLSIAQASIEDNWRVKAIYNEKTLIGFTMYGYSDELIGYEICRLMIDYHFQGNGFGKEALPLIVEEMKKEYKCTEILICFQPDNIKAKNLYKNFGFKNTGKIIKGNVGLVTLFIINMVIYLRQRNVNKQI